VRISARRSNPVDAYSVRGVSRPLELDEEIEPNDGSAQAVPLRRDSKEEGGVRRGVLGIGDVDSYRLDPADGLALLTVALEPGAEGDVAIAVSTAEGTPLGQSDQGKAGAREELVQLSVPARTAVIVQAKRKGRGEAAYTLRWSTAPGGGSPADMVVDEYP
jgi:hypothetical protein